MTDVSFEDEVDLIPFLSDSSNGLDGAEVSAGVHADEGGELLMIANVHEFGASIRVTKKMRGWFMANGFTPPKEGSTIDIPARPYIRPGLDNHEREIGQAVDGLFEELLSGRITAKGFLNQIGLVLRQFILDEYGKNGPPLSSMTVQMKGSSGKLEDTGRLRQSIHFQISI